MALTQICTDLRFAWQAEYGVVSFDERHLACVVRHAHDQARRHATSTVVDRLERTSDG